MNSEEEKVDNLDFDHGVIAKRLKEAREYIGLSQESVAEKMSIPRPAVSSIENGKRKVSSVEIKQFASLYRCSVDFLLGTNNAEESQDELMNALYRATKPLSQSDFEQVLQFAMFLKSAGKPPIPHNDEDI